MMLLPFSPIKHNFSMNDNSITTLSRTAFGALDTTEIAELDPEFLKLMEMYIDNR